MVIPPKISWGLVLIGARARVDLVPRATRHLLQVAELRDSDRSETHSVRVGIELLFRFDTNPRDLTRAHIGYSLIAIGLFCGGYYILLAFREETFGRICDMVRSVGSRDTIPGG